MLQPRPGHFHYFQWQTLVKIGSVQALISTLSITNWFSIKTLSAYHKSYIHYKCGRWSDKVLKYGRKGFWALKIMSRIKTTNNFKLLSHVVVMEINGFTFNDKKATTSSWWTIFKSLSENNAGIHICWGFFFLMQFCWNFLMGKNWMLSKVWTRPRHFQGLPLFIVADSGKNWKCPGLDLDTYDFGKFP